MRKERFLIQASAIVALVLALLIVNVVAIFFYKDITRAVCGYGFDAGSVEYEQAMETGRATAQAVQERGSVLLKNENGALPLKSRKVNLFGWCGSDAGFIYMGGGSGCGPTNDRVSLLDGLAAAGIECNAQLADAYARLPFRRYANDTYTTDPSRAFRLYEPGAEFYTDALMRSARDFSDTAIVVIGRYGQEGIDLPDCQYDDRGVRQENGRHYLELSENEELLLQEVEKNFGTVIVLLNTCNMMETGFLESESIDAAMYIGYTGSFGSIGVGRLLTGDATPSGRLSDTCAYDLSTAASYPNAGSAGVSYYTGLVQQASYIDYAESIYVGYRWYETADEMLFWSDVDNIYGRGYEGVVQYPFGYGLSYTRFRWTVTEVRCEETLTEDGSIGVDIYVENIGEYPGADVVQLYYSPPYKRGGIEKSSIVLGAFAKTGVLEPGGPGEKLTLEIDVRDMASYDCYDANGNGFMGYELDGGEYSFSLRSDCHTVAADAEGEVRFSASVPSEGYKYPNDEKTGNCVRNLFTNFTHPISGASSSVHEPQAAVAYSIDGADCGQEITFLSRSDLFSTLPLQIPSRDGRKIELSLKTHQPFVRKEDAMPPTETEGEMLTLSDMLVDEEGQKIGYNDPKWDVLIGRLSVRELANLSACCGYGSYAVGSIGAYEQLACDGPSGLNLTAVLGQEYDAVCYPAETVLAWTWDWQTAYQMGLSIGEEAAALMIDQWYGPGLNLHRSPLGGRNFEYFSEDPLLSGTLCAYEIYGAKQKGLACYVKHFAANDSDSGRNGQYRWMTEQALRELYLRPFEIAVKKGGANAMMTSVDRIGSTRAAGSYALLTSVLRGEWGFEGSVLTDAYQGGDVHDADENIRAGNDMQMLQKGDYTLFDDLESATAVRALQRAVKNQLYTFVDCKYARAYAENLDMTHAIAQRSDVFAWWVIVLIAADCAAAAGIFFWGRYLAKTGAKGNAPSGEDEGEEGRIM